MKAAIEPDPAVETLRDLLNTTQRESMNQDERWQMLHVKLTKLRAKEPARMRHALGFLAIMLDIELNLDLIMAEPLPKKAEATLPLKNESSEGLKPSTPV